MQIIQSALGGEWDSPNGKGETRAVNYWWRLASGIVSLDFTDKLSEGAKALANMLKEGIKSGTFDPFFRKAVSQKGVARNDGTKTLSEKTKVITRLQGI